MALQYNTIEKEVIILKAVWDLIQDALNYAIFCNFSDPSGVTLMPKGHNDLRLFNILIGDFLSAPERGTLGLEGIPSNAVGADRTYLHYLRGVAANAQLRPGGENMLLQPVERFANWLDTEFTVEGVWLANVEIDTDLTMARLEAIKICSNIAKHNFSRLSRDAKRIREILQRNEQSVTEEESYLIIPDFLAWFHTNIFAYHTSQIGEMLNGIIWGIYDYLLPEFARAYHKVDPLDPDDIQYSYDVPEGIQPGLARTIYWDLMNDIRGKPYIERFKAHWSMTLRY